MRRIAAVVLLFCILCCARPWKVHAEGLPQPDMQSLSTQMEEMRKTLGRFETLIQEQNQRIVSLEKNNQELRARVEGGAELPSGQRIPPATVTLSKPKSGVLGTGFNPEIGVVGDVVATFSGASLDAEGNDRVAVRELELVFGSYIDPYSRLDVTLGIADFEAMQIEEAYITRYGLPFETLLHLGRFFPKIGKAATVHRDTLDTVDEPLVVQRYFGVEGFFKTGADLSKTFDMPWDITGELTGGVLEGGNGEGANTFGESRRRPTLYSHFKTYKEFSDVTDLEIGATHMLGSNDQDQRFEVNVLGFDVTWNYYVTPANKFKWQSEFYVQNRKESFEIAPSEVVVQGDGFERTVGGDVTHFQAHPFGFYSLVDYRIDPRWEIGARADAVQPVNAAPDDRRFETGAAMFLTFHQSEFARFRLQYEHTRFETGGYDNTVFLQGTVAIGQHKHKIL